MGEGVKAESPAARRGWDPSTAPVTVCFDERNDVLNGVLLALPIVRAALTIGGCFLDRRRARRA